MDFALHNPDEVMRSFKKAADAAITNYKKKFYVDIDFINGEVELKFQATYKFSNYSKQKVLVIVSVNNVGGQAYNIIYYYNVGKGHHFDGGLAIDTLCHYIGDDTSKLLIWNTTIMVCRNFDPEYLKAHYTKMFSKFKVPELVVKSEEEKIVERMIGETHFINEDTYVGDVGVYESKVREWIERKNSVGGWIERWKKYYCVNGCWMVMNGGTVRHLMSDVYGLSREEVYLSLWLISQDEEYYVKNWAEVLTPNKLPGYVFYPDGFYGRLGSMRQYLITRGWVDLEIDVVYEIVKFNADYYENRENRLNTEKRDIYNGCKQGV